MFLFFVAAMFSISLASLFFYHVYLVSKNMTTLEAFRAPVMRSGPDRLAFFLGKMANFQEVFGDNRLLWFLPVYSSLGDGCSFPQRAQLDEEAGLLTPPQPTVYPSEEHMPMIVKGRGSPSDDGFGGQEPLRRGTIGTVLSSSSSSGGSSGLGLSTATGSSAAIAASGGAVNGDSLAVQM